MLQNMIKRYLREIQVQRAIRSERLDIHGDSHKQESGCSAEAELVMGLSKERNELLLKLNKLNVGIVTDKIKDTEALMLLLKQSQVMTQYVDVLQERIDAL